MILQMLNNHGVNWIDMIFILKEEMTPVCCGLQICKCLS